MYLQKPLHLELDYEAEKESKKKSKSVQDWKEEEDGATYCI